MKKICIIGSGLSGLSCAHYLQNHNLEIKIFEKNSTPGGRVNSECIDDYICDIGFQVLLNNYDELKKMNVYKQLDMKYFNSGAEIYQKDKNLTLYNPIYHPIKTLRSSFMQIFSIRDIWNILSLLLFNNHTNSTKKAGLYIDEFLSKKLRKLFIYPFFKGVFLSKNLENDLGFFTKLLKKFSFGRAGLPAKGMSGLPKAIIKNANLNVSYNMNLQTIDGNSVTFDNGYTEDFDKIILAIPLHEINKVTNLNIDLHYNSNTTCYFSSTKNILGKSILLVPDEEFEINSIQCLSNVSPKYSNNDNSLYSVSALKPNSSNEKLKKEFEMITGIQQSDISIIKSYQIKYALPKKIEAIENSQSIYFCGDWSQEPSIDGALKSGRLTAKEIILYVEKILSE